jgi:putative membrane-bound dehydrogenase-like protein
MMSQSGLWIAVAMTLAGADGPSPTPPRAIDSRLILERVAAEPEIVTPTGLAVDARGRVFVIESHTHFRPKDYQGPPADRIRLFEDTNGDGKFDRIETFFQGTRMTMNLAFARDGSLFVATRSALYRLEDRDGDGRADGEAATRVPVPFVRLDTPGDYPHNGLSGFAFDAFDNVYFGLGENLGAEYRLKGSDGTTLVGGGEGGNIYRCRPDGSKLERVATGFWNPFHVAFDAFGRLFAVDNDPDSRPPCRLLHIVECGDYGYRFRNGRKGLHPFTAWNGELPGTLPMTAGTGEAPSGLVVYESDNLPDDYRGNVLVTSWGDHRIERYRLQPRGASFRATMEPVVSGGEDFRPVGIATAPDGSLYFSDWVDKSYDLHRKGRVWQLRNRSALPRHVAPKPEENLAHPDRLVRERAARTLAGQGDNGRISLTNLALGSGDPRARAVALEALAATGTVEGDRPLFQLPPPPADLHALEVRLLPAKLLDLRATQANTTSPLVRAEVLRRAADPSWKDMLLKELESDDPFLQQAAREGLKRSLKIPDLIKLADDPDASHRLGILLILRDSGDTQARGLVGKYLADPDPKIRFAAIQWVGEQRLSEYRVKLMDGLASSKLSREAFEGTLAALEMLDGKKSHDPREEVAGEDLVAALVADFKQPPAVVSRGLRMLRPDHPAVTLGRIRHYLASPDATLRLEAVRTLAASPLPGRFEVLEKIATDADAPIPLRAEAIVGLSGDPSKQDALIALAESGQPVLRREALRGLRRHYLFEKDRKRLTAAAQGDDQSLALLAMLLKPTAENSASPAPGPDPSLPPSSDLEAWLAKLEGPADPEAGGRVFFHPLGPGCCKCHQVDGRGGRTGPDLSVLSTGMDRKRLIQSILQPSREIAPQFVPYSVARTDGTVFTGVLVNESPDGTLSFADADGRLIVVNASEIEDKKPQSVSIMPENLPQTITPQEFRDLVAFLLGSRQ